MRTDWLVPVFGSEFRNTEIQLVFQKWRSCEPNVVESLKYILAVYGRERTKTDFQDGFGENLKRHPKIPFCLLVLAYHLIESEHFSHPWI